MARARADDLLQPFQIEGRAASGRLVRLGPLIETILSQHDYPQPVAAMLGETMLLAALISGALKFDGVFTVQTKGDGPIKVLFADITSDGAMRGYAQFDAGRLEDAMREAEAGPREPVPRLLGSGHLAFTVDQGPDTDRYQGIVSLAGATLADCAHAYFRQSDQIDAAVKLAVGRVGDEAEPATWRAGGIMVQRLAGRGFQPQSGDGGEAAADDDWRRTLTLMGSSTTDELLAPDLHPHDLLFRLFHEDGVRVFEPRRLAMECRCSPEKVETMLRSFPREEIEGLKVDGVVVVTCEFCGRVYDYDDAALDALYGSGAKAH